ncbi:MAG TPA: hypothetical protein VF503_03685 [Sphingobium sp.]|uniref:DUF4139 domain-containing protein n=1 Tax=Sphingobium sp. TaxID=1912891 RepID=UPI002ED694EE
MARRRSAQSSIRATDGLAAMLALLPLLLASIPASAADGAVVTSAAPEAVAVTVYRDVNRDAEGELVLSRLNGRALVTETRTVDLPAGPAEIRFEGVADGIVPVSALVTGLPGGTVEKNRDARLLSPAALVDGTLGRHVRIRWTDRKTGKAREEDARIVAGPSDGVVLQTGSGIVALGCSGLAEKPLYDTVPQGLSAKPTLSVRTVSPVAGKAVLHLSYLADDFDWQAHYIGRVSADGRTLDLFAWLTLANGNAVSFDHAETMAVAGRVGQDEDASTGAVPAGVEALSLNCWPTATTSDIPEWQVYNEIYLPSPAAPMAEIMVTARRRAENAQDVPVSVLMAQQEELGDLKLYRIPEPVTVAANSQKQVALLNRRDVPFRTVYGLLVQPENEDAPQQADIILRLRNREKDGLGLPLPAGPIAVMAPRGDRDLRVGEGHVDDTAIGQEVNLSVGRTAQVRGALTPLGAHRWRYEISNANPFAVDVEAALALGGAVKRLPKRNGLPLWSVHVPANGRRSIDLGVEPPKKD